MDAAISTILPRNRAQKKHPFAYHCEWCHIGYYYAPPSYACQVCGELVVGKHECADCGQEIWADHAVNWQDLSVYEQLDPDGKIYCRDCRKLCRGCLNYEKVDGFKDYQGTELCENCYNDYLEEIRDDI